MSFTHLANSDPQTAWAHQAWSEFPALSAPGRTLALLPIHGFADHGLGQPLDTEEIVASEVLRLASLQVSPVLPLCILPPLRFALAPTPATFFGVDPDTAHETLLAIARGVEAAGFQRLLLINSSPWNLELVDAASRDIRAALNLQTFVINLAGLGLDLHPASTDRARVQAVASHLLGVPPVPSGRPVEVSAAAFRPGNWRQPAPVSIDPALDGAALLAKASRHLAQLLAEIEARGPLGSTRHGTPVTLPSATAITAPAPALFPQRYRSRYLPALTRDALESLSGKERALVIIATGAIEQHGHHLPVGVDAILGQAWLENALPRLAADTPVYVAPPITYAKSNEHLGFPGTVFISASLLRRQLLALAGQLSALGFRRIGLLNTHGGNTSVLLYTLREIQHRLGLEAGLIESGYEPPLSSSQESTYGFHAGEWETALMLAVAGETVQMDRAVCEFPARIEDLGELRPECAPAVFSWITKDISQSGVMGDATLGSLEKGKVWLEASSAALAAKIEHLAKQADQPPSPGIA